MSNALTLITGEINAIKDDFMTLLSDRSIKFEQEAGYAVQILGGNEFALSVAVSNRASVINAVKNIAAIGISLNPAKKQAYLVPRKPAANKPAAICLDISYMGLLDLAVASGSIRWGQAELVRQNDTFKLNGFDKPPTHAFDPFGKDRGDLVGVYVVVKTHDGDYLTTTMPIDEVFSIRDRSEAWKAFREKKIKSCPWVSDEGEMVKKTVIKRAYKTWPKTDRLDNAIHHLNTDGGEGLRDINERPESVVDVTPLIAAALKTKTDAEALKFWRENNAAVASHPADHKKLKDAITGHRARMADALRTIDAQVKEVESEQHQPTDAELEAADLARSEAA